MNHIAINDNYTTTFSSSTFLSVTRNIQWVFLVFLFSGLGVGMMPLAQAQHISEESGKENREIHRQNIEIFLGDTYFLHHQQGAFTLGLDYEYRFSVWHNQIGLGILADYEFGTEEVGGGLLIGPSLIFFPFGGNFKIFASPGVAIGGKEQETHTVGLFRAGAGYEFDIHHLILLAPTISLDLTNEHTAIVGGVAVGLGI